MALFRMLGVLLLSTHLCFAQRALLPVQATWGEWGTPHGIKVTSPQLQKKNLPDLLLKIRTRGMQVEGTQCTFEVEVTNTMAYNAKFFLAMDTGMPDNSTKEKFVLAPGETKTVLFTLGCGKSLKDKPKAGEEYAWCCACAFEYRVGNLEATVAQ